jgi:hypothetical protein
MDKILNNMKLWKAYFFPSFSIFIFSFGLLNAANSDHEQDYSYTVDNQELYNEIISMDSVFHAYNSAT